MFITEINGDNSKVVFLSADDPTLCSELFSKNGEKSAHLVKVFQRYSIFFYGTATFGTPCRYITKMST